MRIRCRCQWIFTIQLETRSFYRKAPRLQGRYVKPQRGDFELLTVEDISFTGIHFRTRFSHDLQVEDILHVTFVLDNSARSELTKAVTVKHINGRQIGAEFCERQAFDTEPTYYLNAGA